MALRSCIISVVLFGLVAAQFSYEGRFVSSNGAMSATWKVSADEKTIDFELKGKTKGWLAIGFNNASKMAGAEHIYGWVDKLGNPFVYSGYSLGHKAPTSTRKNQITKIRGSQSGPITTISFSRPVGAMNVTGSKNLKTATHVLMAIGRTAGVMVGEGAAGRIAKHSDYASARSQFVKNPSTVTISNTIAPTATSSKGGSFTDNDNKVTIRWVVQGSDIFFQIIAETEGYVAVGLNSKPSMVDADIYVAFQDNGNNVLLDQFATAHSRPLDDTSFSGQNNAHLVSMNRDNNKLTVVFKRALNTKDARDFAITNTPCFLLWAIGNDIGQNGDKQYGRHSEKGATQVNLMN